MMTNAKKEFPIDSAEEDYCSSLRHVYCYLDNGRRMGTKIKRKMNRRFRTFYKKHLHEYQKELNYAERNSVIFYDQFQVNF